MKKALNSLYQGYSRLKLGLLLAVCAVYLAIVAYSGGSLLQLALFALVVAGYIVLPGLLFVRLIGPKDRPEGFTGPLAIIYGAGFFAALYCVAMRLSVLWLLHALPVALSAVYVVWAVLRLRRRGPGRPAPGLAQITPARWMMLLLYAALLLLFAFYGAAKYGRPLAVGDVLPNQDLYWNAGNAASFKLAFPPQDIRFVGVRLHYHYLTELVAGALSLASGISPYNILAFYLQPFVLAAMVLCLYRFARVVFENSLFKSLLFTYSMFLFSCASLWKILPNGLSVFWNANIVHLVTNINSQSTAVMLLCVFCGLFVHASRRRYKVGVVYLAATLAAFFLLCFAKGPLAALVAAAVVLTLLVGLFLRQTGWRGVVLGVLTAGIFALVYFTMFASGANDSMTFVAFGTLEKGYFYNILEAVKQTSYTLWEWILPLFWLIQSFLMLPAQFPLYVCGVFSDLRRFTRLAPERLLFNAMAVGGLLAYFLFNHPHMSQTYFLYGAIFFVNLLATDGTDRLARWRSAARRSPGQNGRGRLGAWRSRGALALVAACAAVGVATTGFLYVHMLGSGARQLARNLGLEKKHPYELVMTPDDEAAMLWLKANSPADAVFATNRIHTGGRREGISNVYSALCERQGYMEGFQYAKTNMGVSEAAIMERMAVNTALFSSATPPQDIPALCLENGIDYLVFCTQMGGVDASDAQLAGLELVYSSPGVRIYKAAAGEG